MALNNLGDVLDSGTNTPDTTAVVSGATTASTSVTIASANSNIFIGQVVTGPGVQQANGIVGPTTITAISTNGLTLTLSNLATFVSGVTLTFSSPYSLVATGAVSGAVSNSTSITLAVANTAIAVGQLVSTQYALGASTAPTAPIFVSAISSTSLTVTSPVTISDAAVITFWTPVNVATAVEQAWGNFPIQPNDERATIPVYNFGGSGTQSVTISAASKPTKGTILFTTSAAHGLSVGATVSTGLYVASGSTVYSTTATINAGTKDSTLLTTACTTSATHYIAPGSLMSLSSTNPTAYGTSPNGSYIALSVPDKTHVTLSTQSTTFTTNNIGSKDASVTSLAALTSATVTYYPFDVKEVKIISVPSSTTFVVASASGWSGDSTDTGIGAQTGLTGSLALVADASWAQTVKVQSSRLDGGSITSTRNTLSYITPTYDTYATAAYGTFPNYIAGKFAVSGVTATTNYLVYTAVNNLTKSNTVNITGVSIPAFNQSGATIVAVKGDTIVTSNPSTTGTVSGATSASTTVTLSAANNAIKVGMGVTGSNISGTATVVAVANTLVTLSTPQSLSNSDTLTFKIAAGTTLAGERGVAAAANFGIANYNVTAVKGDGTTITYTAQNNLAVGDAVNITGLGNGAFNLSNATVATANATTFTVTNSGGSGITLTGQVGKVEYYNASANIDGGFVSGTYYPQIPSIIGQTATVAADTFSDRGLTGLAASAVTNGAVPTTTPKGNGAASSAYARIAGSNVVEITANEAISGVVASGSGNTVTRGSGTAITNVKVGQTVSSTTITPARNITAVDYSTGAITFDSGAVGTVTGETLTITGHGFVTGDVVTVTGADATLNGDQVVLVKDVSTVLIATNSTAALSGTTGVTLTGKAAYVHAQSVAAGTQSQAPSTAVTYSVWG
jgi:hypothetical protein